jgi:hypothetical protein
MGHAIAFATGVVFSLGLGLGGMTQPARIIGFLDVFGQWDPTLVFVLGGAVGTYMALYAWVRRRRRPVYGASFQIPPTATVDRRLLLGAGLFGVGWGIGGFCPGPAITALASAQPVPIVFVLSMLGGMALFDYTPLGALRRPARVAAQAVETSPGAITDA